MKDRPVQENSSRLIFHVAHSVLLICTYYLGFSFSFFLYELQIFLQKFNFLLFITVLKDKLRCINIFKSLGKNQFKTSSIQYSRERKLKGAVQNESIFQAEGGRARKLYQAKKEIGYKVTFPQRMAGISQAVYLTTGSRRVLTDWFRIPFLRELKLQLVQSQSGHMERSRSNSILGLWSCF